MFAIVVIAGKQYTVRIGDIVEVDRIEGNAGDVVKLDQVLLLSDGKKISVGTPMVKGAVVKVKIVAQEKGKKVSVRRYKSKVRYRKAIGFRSQVTKLEVTAIS